MIIWVMRVEAVEVIHIRVREDETPNLLVPQFDQIVERVSGMIAHPKIPLCRSNFVFGEGFH